MIQVFLFKRGDGLELQLSGGVPSWHAQGPEFNWKGGKKVHMNTQVRKRLNRFDSSIYKLDEWTDLSPVVNPYLPSIHGFTLCGLDP